MNKDRAAEEAYESVRQASSCICPVFLLDEIILEGGYESTLENFVSITLGRRAIALASMLIGWVAGGHLLLLFRYRL
jgi:hypothetical protein